MPSHCNSYGFSGGFAAICAAISWYLVQERDCKINLAGVLSGKFDNDQLQMFHYIAIIVGVVLFVLSFFDFAGILYEVKLLFVAAAIGIVASSVMMAYATYMSFWMSCKSALGTFFDTASLTGHKNVIEANDEVGIIILVLDLLCACMLLSAAISFSRTW